ncbi:hypothetical protein CRYUN_Cryun08bG0140200 [Craigia yunnanensis]
MPDWFFGNLGLHELFDKFIEAKRNTYAIVANTCHEIEPKYIKHYEKITEKPNSVLYVCFGSLCEFAESQLLQIALGLEASNISFIWVIKDDKEVFAAQFYNENFVLTRLRIGVGIGVESGLAWGEEEKIGVLVKGEQVKEIVTMLTSEGEDVEGMRKRASQLSELARWVVSKGRSSYLQGLLIEDLLKLRREKIRNKSLN